ncbi:MAG: hypothetical protein JSS77_09885 [Acidobacteria bacterium]|nr:hypothetical protein [Acidobacteriota bacterium]HMU32974.1 hypothetical protein [Pyrinomonadaceae bacterium]
MTGRSLLILIFALSTLLLVAGNSHAQDRSDEETPAFPRRTRQQQESPKGVRDMLIRMRIEKAKKDYEKMLDQGDSAAKLSGQIKASVEKASALSNADRGRLQELDKLTSDVLDDLGGDEDALLALLSDKKVGPTPIDAATELDAAVKLMVSELKKTTRFTVSASAIESTADVLRIVRKLKTYQ